MSPFKPLLAGFLLLMATAAHSTVTTHVFAVTTRPAHHFFPDTLSKKEVLERMKKIIAKELNVKPENIKMESNFAKDFGADDLDSVELVMGFEDEFKISIPDRDASYITTVRSTYEYLLRRLKVKK